MPPHIDSFVIFFILSDTNIVTNQKWIAMRHEAKRTVDGALSSLSEKEQSQLFSMLYRMKTELSLANEGQSEKEEE